MTSQSSFASRVVAHDRGMWTFRLANLSPHRLQREIDEDWVETLSEIDFSPDAQCLNPISCLLERTNVPIFDGVPGGPAPDNLLATVVQGQHRVQGYLRQLRRRLFEQSPDAYSSIEDVPEAAVLALPEATYVARAYSAGR